MDLSNRGITVINVLFDSERFGEEERRKERKRATTTKQRSTNKTSEVSKSPVTPIHRATYTVGKQEPAMRTSNRVNAERLERTREREREKDLTSSKIPSQTLGILASK